LAHSISDNLHARADASGASFLGVRWDVLLGWVGGAEAVWAEGEERTLWNARLFPVFTPRDLHAAEAAEGGGVNSTSVNGSGVNAAGEKSAFGPPLPPSAWSLFCWLLEGVPPPPGWASSPRVSMCGAAARAAVDCMMRARRDLADEIDTAELCARVGMRRVGRGGGDSPGGAGGGGGGASGCVVAGGGGGAMRSSGGGGLRCGGTNGGGGAGRDDGPGAETCAAETWAALPILPLLRRLSTGSLNTFSRLLASLDGIAAGTSSFPQASSPQSSSPPSSSTHSPSPQSSAHAFAAVAEALCLRAAGRGGLRTGPAANTEWGAPLALLRSGLAADAARALAAVRDKWTKTDRPRDLIRAARHYDSAVAICVALCVRTCAVRLPPPSLPLPVCAWAVAEAAARVDLAGGWTDTPPLCFEAGGCVAVTPLPPRPPVPCPP
jgi:hypothetical protein